MARFVKLPDNLKSWKINSRLSEEKGNEVYKISKKEYDGTIVNAVLRYVLINGESYSSDNVDFINEEATFLKTVSQSGDFFNYVDVTINNSPAKEKIELFIITEDLQPLAEVLNSKTLTDTEIVDFGIQMSAILEKLEANNIFHGNINPENIFVTADGRYKLGGFSDFESKISDMSFVAPEIYKKENADFTTDIYSLGLIMYYMCNNKTLPFMSGDVSKDDAIKARFEGRAVTAPVNGDEKLKSVIVIACQPNNENRWKNAGNIKNALTSIKSDNGVAVQNKNVIAPESTDFDGNVFEEFDYEEFDESADKTKDNAEVIPVATANVIADEVISNVTEVDEAADQTTENTVENDDNSAFEIEEVTEVKKEIVEDTKSEVIEDEPEIDNRVFDNYEVQPKVVDFKQQVKDKDYGDYFEDDVKEPEASSVSVEQTNEPTEYDVTEKDNYDYDVFDTEDTQDKSKNKKNTAVIIICIVVMLAVLGFIAFCIINGLSSGEPNNNVTTAPEATTTTATQATTAVVTTEPTTVAPTTAEPTTVATDKTVIPVVGYGYSYAKKLLEQEGFVVEIGEYSYSTEYDAGYVINQSPEGDTIAESGTVVVLDISSGLIEEETEAPAEVSQQSSNSSDNTYLFANSDSAYLSKADVSSLSRENLNFALNEIYARRGRIFNDSTLSSYFNSKSWYNPRYTSNEFEQNVTFNKYEQANLQLMVNEQKDRGYR